MSKMRAEIAASVPQVLLAKERREEVWRFNDDNGAQMNLIISRAMVKTSVRYADALLEELARTEP